MPLLKKEKIVVNDVLGRPRKRWHVVYLCDQCEKEFVGRAGSLKPSDLTFCSRTCSDAARAKGCCVRKKMEKARAINDPTGEIARSKYIATSLARYGYTHPTHSPRVRQKISESVRSSDANGEKTRRTREGVQRRYGEQYTSVLQVPEVRRKIEQIFIERYGGPSPMCSPNVVEKFDYDSIQVKAMQTWLERYGVAHPMQSDEVRAKAIRTCLERYGVPHPMMHPTTRQKALETCQARYGVDCNLQRPEAIALAQRLETKQRAFETLKSRGLNYVSQIEQRFVDSLVNYLGDDNIVTQVWVNRWPIDVYVKPVKTYVQFDGVYWHGVHRTLEELALSSSPRDRTIFLKKKRDIEQNHWFSQHNMRLKRYTDEEFKKDSYDAGRFIREVLYGENV